jgi:hypothetical protein
MGEVILGIVFAVIVTAAIFTRESFRTSDQSGIFCPRSKSVVEIRHVDSSKTESLRIVGVAQAGQRVCVIQRRADA